MGDMADDFNAFRHHKKEKRAARLVSSSEVLATCGIPHTWLTQYQVRFHLDGKPRVDLYPSSARWVFRFEGKKVTKTMYGNIHQFLAWYKKQAAGADGVSVKNKTPKLQSIANNS